MSILRRFCGRLYNVVRRGPAEGQLAREVASHLALLEERFRARGLAPEEARVAARRAFGGVEQAKEIQRDARSFVWLDDARRDLAYAARTLYAAPGFTFVAVLTLALGIGAVTVIYSVINNVLFDPLPYTNSDRLVNVVLQDTQNRGGRSSFSPSELLDFTEGATVFEDVVGTLGTSMMLTGREHPEYIRAVWVTPNFFEFMGLDPLIGQGVRQEDVRADRPPVAVLRHRAWVSFFGSDPDIVGKTIVLNGQARTIVAVMPPRFTWHAADVWLPAPLDRAASEGATTARNFQARLKPGVTPEEAEAQLTMLAVRRARAHPAEYPENFRMQVLNVIEFTVGEFSRVLYITLAAVAALLLIACCNVANMLLTRATVREREMTVRAALGAGRGRIVRQLLVESLLLAAGGATAGCLIAYAGLDALVALLPPGPLPGEVEISLDGAALRLSLATTAVSALLFGIAPALYSARRDLVEGLKGAGKNLTGGRSRLRHVLVTGEIALSLVLLLGAGLLMRTFVSLVRVDLGFEPGKILVVPVLFAPGHYTVTADKQRFYEQALQRIAALPGVESAAATTYIPPYGGASRSPLQIPGTTIDEGSWAVVQSCTEDCFRTLGIRLLRGHGLTAVRPGEAHSIAVVNRSFMLKYLKGQDPLGRSIKLSSPQPGSQGTDGPLEIVGVVDDVRNQGIRNPAAPHVYLGGAATGMANPVILVRTIGEPLAVLSAVRGEIAAVDRQVAIRLPDSLESVLQRGFYAQPRFSLVVLGIFAVIGTLLVAIGVFSVMAYTVSRQKKEIAVRMALGAGRRHAVGVVLRPGAQLLAAGVAIGLLASFATSRLIANQLWNVSPYDPLTAAGATCIIAIVAMAACYIPARRAATVDPMVALRQD